MRKYLSEKARRLFLIDVIAIAIFLMVMPVMASAESAIEAKISFTEGQFANGESGRGIGPDIDSPITSKSRGAFTENISSPYRIYDAQVNLYFDDDRDGHFYGLDVLFDADTDYFAADVYARLYLSLEGGQWEHYYTTEYFAIFGASGVDDYQVQTELFDGYPTGYYDVLIELYDEFGHIVAVLGPDDTSELSVLPLEDQVQDSPPYTPVGGSAVSHGGGGAIGILSLLAMGGFVILRRKKHGNQLSSRSATDPLALSDSSAIRCSSSNQAPRSIKRQRSLQKGRQADFSDHSTVFRQVGQLTCMKN